MKKSIVVFATPRLVREWDLEALAIETTNILEKGAESVEPPKIPSWRDSR